MRIPQIFTLIPEFQYTGWCMGLTRMSATEFLTFYRCFSIASAKVGIFFKPAIGCSKKMRKKFFFYDFYPLHRISISEKTYFCIINQS